MLTAFALAGQPLAFPLHVALHHSHGDADGRSACGSHHDPHTGHDHRHSNPALDNEPRAPHHLSKASPDETPGAHRLCVVCQHLTASSRTLALLTQQDAEAISPACTSSTSLVTRIASRAPRTATGRAPPVTG